MNVRPWKPPAKAMTAWRQIERETGNLAEDHSGVNGDEDDENQEIQTRFPARGWRRPAASGDDTAKFAPLSLNTI